MEEELAGARAFVYLDSNSAETPLPTSLAQLMSNAFFFFCPPNELQLGRHANAELIPCFPTVALGIFAVRRVNSPCLSPNRKVARTEAVRCSSTNRFITCSLQNKYP